MGRGVTLRDPAMIQAFIRAHKPEKGPKTYDEELAELVTVIHLETSRKQASRAIEAARGFIAMVVARSIAQYVEETAKVAKDKLAETEDAPALKPLALSRKPRKKKTSG